MRVLMSGASGLVGRALRQAMTVAGDTSVALIRQPASGASAPGLSASGKPGHILWDPCSDRPPEGAGGSAGAQGASLLEGFDAAVHLSGENLGDGRWTAARKAAFRSSRVDSTRRLAALLAGCAAKPGVLVCASAIGWYGDRGDEILTEDSAPGTGFLPELCQEWEAASSEAEQAGIRVVHLRFGVVLARGGGALGKMLPLFRAGLGGRLGSGRQWVSWISLSDVVGAVRFAIANEPVRGPVNTVAPNPVTNAEFARELGRVLHRPSALPAPAFALRAALGEMADATVLSSARVLPKRLEEAGFVFKHTSLSSALRAELLG